MAEVISPTQQAIPGALESLQLTADTRLPPPAQTIVVSATNTSQRNGHLNLDTFSPVNQKGHFEFDRVLKSGVVQKRNRKTKVSSPPCAMS